jgi:hypothetical protein
MKEEWKEIKGYEGFYKVSNLGRVKSLERKVWSGNVFYKRKEQLLKPYILNTGYYAVDLYVNKRKRKATIHRLVAESFLENKMRLHEVDHINREKTDNRLSNLRWCSRSDNSRNCKRHEKSETKYIGAYMNRKKWISQIRIKGKLIQLGRFNFEIQAALAYNEYVIKNNLDRELNIIC